MTRGRKKKADKEEQCLTDSLAANIDGFETNSVELSGSSEENNIITLYAAEHTELSRGRNIIKTGYVLPCSKRGIVCDTVDNAANGFCAENGYRLQRSFVIPVAVCSGEVDVVLFVDEDTAVIRLTDMGARTRNVCIEKGSPIAQIIVEDKQ